MKSPLEKLRHIWTPGSEIQEVVADLNPGTELDSMIRHILHAVIQQHGARTIDLGNPAWTGNEGTLRFEAVYGPGPDLAPELRRPQLAVWIER